MHVGLDLLFLVPGRTGGRETHVRELLRAMALRDDRPRLTAFVGADVDGPGWWSDWTDRVVRLPRVSAERRASWALGELAGVGRAAARAGVDVVHGPANFAPVAGPFTRVVTLHDVLFRRHPELLSPAMRVGTELLVPPAVRRAHRVITVSKASRDDIVALLGVPAQRVEVIPNALPPRAGVGDAAGALARLGAGAGAGAGRPVALSVATDLPQKNLPALLEALALLDPSERPLLAIAGAGTGTGELPGRARALGVADDVRLLGAVTPAELEDLYAAAAVYVTATLYEGFGFPPLEAMARDVPVACSDLPVLREVAGEAAHWLDPHDPATIATALRRLTTDTAERDRLVALGRARAQGYTWDATAEATIAVYHRVSA